MWPQNAKVVQLDEATSNKALELYKAKELANKNWDVFVKEQRNLHKDFSDIEFSKDFKFMVPSQEPATGNWIPVPSITCPIGMMANPVVNSGQMKYGRQGLDQYTGQGGYFTLQSTSPNYSTQILNQWTSQ